MVVMAIASAFITVITGCMAATDTTDGVTIVTDTTADTTGATGVIRATGTDTTTLTIPAAVPIPDAAPSTLLGVIPPATTVASTKQIRKVTSKVGPSWLTEIMVRHRLFSAARRRQTLKRVCRKRVTQ